MPYNNTPIAPPQEWTGSVSLPLARVKKIIHADDDIGACSNNAAFVIAVATEMFVQHLVEQTYTVVKSERRPRRNIQYRDVASAVSRLDNLEFLTDVVPRTMTYKQFKDKKATKDSAPRANGTEAALQQPLMNGQRTLEQMSRGGRSQQMEEDGEAENDGDGEEDGDVRMGGQYDGNNEQAVEGEEDNSEDDDDNSDVVVVTGTGHVNGDGTPGRAREFQGVVVPTPESRGRAPPARHAYDAVRDRFDT